MMPLAQARVLVVGAGGLGCPASLALAAGGVRSLTLVDPDRVDVTNLHRQLWHRPADLGRWKVESAAQGLLRAFPPLRVQALAQRVDADSAPALFAAHDLVVDATDGMATKFLLSDVAKVARVPLVYGGVLRMQGQAMRIEPEGPCLRCLFEELPDPETVPTCAQAGVLGAMAGVVGSIQALEALKLVGGVGEPLLDRMLQIDGRDMSQTLGRTARRQDCPACAAE